MGKRVKVVVLFLILIAGFISAAAVQEDLHVNIQALNSSDDVVTGTFTFGFNISMSSNCTDATNVVYANTSSLTTDSRGIIDYYLPNVTLNYSSQYWLCHYRDNALINSTKISRVPYTFAARNVSAQGIINNSNINLVGYNITGSSGLFSFLGSLASRITDLFVTNIDFTGKINGSGWINTTSNISASWFFGISNQSDTLDSYNSSFFMPLNTSVTGNFDFNGGWQSNGFSIIGGDIYARVGYFYNISSLEVNSLIINGSLIPIWDNNFDLGNASFMWRTIRTAIVNSSGVMYYNNGTLVNSTLFTIANTTANIRELLAGTNISQYALNQSAGLVGINTTANIRELLAGTNISQYAFNQTAATVTGYNTRWALNETQVVNLQALLNNSNMYFSSLGINTGTPVNRLHVTQDTSSASPVSQYIATLSDSNSGGNFTFEDGTGSTNAFTPVFRGSSVSNVVGLFIIGNIPFANDAVLANTGAITMVAAQINGSALNGQNLFTIRNAGVSALTIDASSRVGIGTTTPTHLLNVFGNTNLSGDVSLGNNSELFVDDSTGNVGIGTTSPREDLDVFVGGVSGDPDITISDGDISHSFTSITDNEVGLQLETSSSSFGGAFITGFTDGSVSALTLRGFMGVADPTDSISAMVFRAGKLSGTTSADLGSLETAYQFQDSDGGTNFVTILGSGNVGIGTTTPGYLLEVDGSFGISGRMNKTSGFWDFYQNTYDNAYTFIVRRGGSDGPSFVMRVGDNNVSLRVGEGTPAITFNQTYVGIFKTTIPTAGVEFDVEGQAECDGAGCWAVESDISYKENIQNLSKYGLSDVLKMRTTEFDYKDTKEHGFGLIAQELKLIVPELVGGEEGSYNIGYGGLTPILVKAIQEQQVQIEILKSQNRLYNETITKICTRNPLLCV